MCRRPDCRFLNPNLTSTNRFARPRWITRLIKLNRVLKTQQVLRRVPKGAQTAPVRHTLLFLCLASLLTRACAEPTPAKRRKQSSSIRSSRIMPIEGESRYPPGIRLGEDDGAAWQNLKVETREENNATVWSVNGEDVYASQHRASVKQDGPASVTSSHPENSLPSPPSTSRGEPLDKRESDKENSHAKYDIGALLSPEILPGVSSCVISGRVSYLPADNGTSAVAAESPANTSDFAREEIYTSGPLPLIKKALESLKTKRTMSVDELFAVQRTVNQIGAVVGERLEEEYNH